MTHDSDVDPMPKRPIVHGIDVMMWALVARSVFAIALGLSLTFIPERTNSLVANLIGGFWIGTGILTIRWGFADQRSKSLTLVTGLAAIVAGSLAYGRHLLRHYIPEESVLILLGLVAILTGILHLSGQIPSSRLHGRSTERSRIALGMFEIGLGVAILLQGRGPMMYEAMAAWALLGGLILLGDALILARQDRRARADQAQVPTTDGANDPPG